MDEAFKPREQDAPVILGLRLKPLTLGHLFLLEEIQSPFLDPSFPSLPSVKDLLLAVFICCTPPADSRKNLRAWWFGIFLWAWSLRLSNFKSQICDSDPFTAFEDYLAEGRDGPRLKQRTQCNLRPYTTPDLWRLYVRLRRELHMPKPEAWDTTVHEARAIDCTLADLDGDGSVEDQRDRDFWEAVAKADQEALKQDPHAFDHLVPAVLCVFASLLLIP